MQIVMIKILYVMLINMNLILLMHNDYGSYLQVFVLLKYWNHNMYTKFGYKISQLKFITILLHFRYNILVNWRYFVNFCLQIQCILFRNLNIFLQNIILIQNQIPKITKNYQNMSKNTKIYKNIQNITKKLQIIYKNFGYKKNRKYTTS